MTDEVFLRWSAIDPPEVAPGVGALVKLGAAIEVGKITATPGTQLKSHAHPEEQFFFMLEGQLRYKIGKVEEVAGPGDLVHFPKDVVHAGAVEGDVTAVFIEIKERIAT